jgi:hypothetical protein
MSGFVAPALFFSCIIMKLASHNRFWRLTGLLALDAGLFGVTNASRAPSVVLMIGFVLMVVTLYQLLNGLVSLSSLYGVKLKCKQRLVRSLTLVISGLVALQSIGQLSQRDILVALPLAFLAYLYSAYAQVARRNLSG